MSARRFSRIFLLGLIALLVAGTVSVTTPAASAADSYAHLDPGGPANLPETVPVNVVFVGYEPGNVNTAAFRAGLPNEYKPVARYRLFYGIEEYLGLNYTFDYNLVFADSAYEGRLFNFLSSAAKPAPLTLFQQEYNAQARNVLDVKDNHFIDAPSVEKWLAANPPAGVDTARNTVFFINWWGNGTTPRSGFKHHVYTKTGEPDPDTGFDFGAGRQSRKIIAWGGTTADDEETGLGSTHRIWFHDLSAGPESWTDNWNVDTPDLDGDGVEDYRMPPVWEYFAPGGYRAAAALSGDLAKLTRYVAIDLLFTTSPLYAPGFSPERLPARVNLDFNTYEGLSGVDASTRYQKPAFIQTEIRELHRVPYSNDVQRLAFAGEAQNCYILWLRAQQSGSGGNLCYPDRPQYPGFANLFLYNALNVAQLRDDDAVADNDEYEALFVNYAVQENLDAGFLGFAEDNYIDGTQSFIFSFLSPAIIASGYGLSTTEIHEFGHHLAMSHPHDGYDYEDAVDFDPSGPFQFAWAGDEQNSMMSYIDLNWDFSQFDRDNNNRFQAAAYIANANGIAAKVLASRNAGIARADLRAADGYIGRAKAALAAHDYVATFDFARLAYESVRSGATKAGVTVTAGDRGVTVTAPIRGNRPAQKKADTYIDKIGPDSHRARP